MDGTWNQLTILAEPESPWREHEAIVATFL